MTAEEERLVRRYRFGMGALGILLVTAYIPALPVALVLGAMMASLTASSAAFWSGVLIVLGVGLAAGPPVVLGLFALRLHNWVNWVVLVVGGLLTLVNIIAVSAGARLEPPELGSAILAIALVVIAICNVAAARRLARSSLDPRLLPDRPGSPQARPRR